MMPITIDGELYYTASEAIDYLRVSRDTFYRWLKTQHIPQYRQGLLKRVYYRQSDLDTLKKLRQVNGGER